MWRTSKNRWMNKLFKEIHYVVVNNKVYSRYSFNHFRNQSISNRIGFWGPDFMNGKYQYHIPNINDSQVTSLSKIWHKVVHLVFLYRMYNSKPLSQKTPGLLHEVKPGKRWNSTHLRGWNGKPQLYLSQFVVWFTRMFLVETMNRYTFHQNLRIWEQ